MKTPASKARFVLGAVSLCLCAGLWTPAAAAGADAPTPALLPQTDAAKQEHDVRYLFFFRFLTEGIAIPKNYAVVKQNLGTQKLQKYWARWVDGELPKPTGEVGEIEVTPLDWGKESWLLKFPAPKSMPLVSYAIVYSADGVNARLFTLERTMKLDDKEPGIPAMVCECGFEDGKFIHGNCGVVLDAADKDGFLKVVKQQIDASQPPAATTTIPVSDK